MMTYQKESFPGSKGYHDINVKLHNLKLTYFSRELRNLGKVLLLFIQSLTKYLKLKIKIISMLENFYTTYLRNTKKNLIASL